MAKPIAVAVHLEDVDVVGQPVEQSSGQAFGAEGFGPFVEWQVAGDHCGAALIALRDQLEQEFRAGLAQRHEAQLVDDEQLVSGHLLLEAQKTAIGYNRIITDGKVAKISVVGVGMKSHTGVAGKMFEVLAKAGVNIDMISTSEIKISVVIAKNKADEAARVAHKAFELEKL